MKKEIIVLHLIVTISFVFAAPAAPAKDPNVRVNITLNSANKVYRMITKTGDDFLAGTDANIYVKLAGSAGETGAKKLDTEHENNFERGKTDEFDVYTGDLGELKTLTLFRDNFGPSPGWYLDEIKLQVRDVSTGTVYQCASYYNGWFPELPSEWTWQLAQDCKLSLV